MEKGLTLDAFVEALTTKGYDGHFLTQAAYPDKMKESIERYLEACKAGPDALPQHRDIQLTCYLKWSGEEKPFVESHMGISYKKGLLDVRTLEISRKDSFGKTLKKQILNNLTTSTMPSKAAAVALVAEEKQKTRINPGKGFRLR